MPCCRAFLFLALIGLCALPALGADSPAELASVVARGPGLYARPGVRLFGDQGYDWKFEGGFTWNF